MTIETLLIVFMSNKNWDQNYFFFGIHILDIITIEGAVGILLGRLKTACLRWSIVGLSRNDHIDSLDDTYGHFMLENNSFVMYTIDQFANLYFAFITGLGLAP